MSRQLEVVVLAAGQGTRMRSDLPKVLHPLAGRPLLSHVLETATALSPRAVHVVYGHGGERVREALPEWPVAWVAQAEQLGTGHALAQAQPDVAAESAVLVLYGDVPLITAETVAPLVEVALGGGVGLLTALLDDPAGYGRIIRDDGGRVARIVEQKDATTQELVLREVNTGIMALPAGRLAGWLERLSNDNAQGEYYLTDVIAMARKDGVAVTAVVAADVEQTLGVNDRLQLAQLERAYQRRQAESLMRAGVTLVDPARFDLRGTLEVGRDVILDANVILEGHVRLGDGVRVGANCLLRNVEVAAGATIEPMSLLEEAKVGPRCQVGPYARLRPGTELAAGAKVGNFVEVKKSVIGPGSKVNHLSYIGDTTMGAEVNVGAGTITCNYDGANKHRTVIGDRAFIGSDTQLVAPVEVGAGATIGAGSTVTKDAPAEALTLSRSKQQTLAGWQRPRKEKG